ncbi:MAG: tetratricopeptide repeat protein [Acidobacteria bacterium]|nr:tetratricopeptide repeat protein [Acidobacteriota bacterium]
MGLSRWLGAAAISLGLVLAAPIEIDYPAPGSVFPPDFPAPLFVWRDSTSSVAEWRIEVTFAGGAPALQVRSRGERVAVGESDPRAVAETNRPPELSAREKAARSWRPDAGTWAAIQRGSVEQPAMIRITGWRNGAVSEGRVAIRTSRDPVGAPIFYRDVPLMPSELERGVIKPLAQSTLPLIAWRLRNVSETGSQVLLEDMHTCANCHSFSRDGKTLAMDLDGPQNDKGLYAIAPIAPRTTIRNQDVIEWKAFRDQARGPARVGFMSQVSPDGQYIATTVNADYYVANFKDYRFLQVFYPTRGTLAWYHRVSGKMQTLPGADDPRFVHTSAVWSPDGKYLVFARAAARDAYPAGRKMAESANDANETPIQYDLYRIPFNQGRGGRAEPIAGAGANGMSNSFPKVSPDGRWIVFVQARNGQLMRPDSQLYIVPAAGGTARKMLCNTPLMNSWHSFSPNGRWMVFSSKSRTPYTQMFLTHLDEDGGDSPAILIENATAANRAVNIPEFVNLPPGGLAKIDVPAAEFYRLYDHALALTEKGQDKAAIAAWDKALSLAPGDSKAHNHLGLVLLRQGHPDQAIVHLERSLALNPDDANAHNNLGLALLRKDRFDEAVTHWNKALEIDSEFPQARFNLGKLAYLRGHSQEALAHWRAALRQDPDWLPLLEQTAWVLATCPEVSVRNGTQAAGLAERAARLSGGRDPAILDALAAAYAEAGRFPEAMQTARRALDLAVQQGRPTLEQGLIIRLALYGANAPYRETRQPSSSRP